ncbi:MAG: hemin uptake protein HemP [Paracoccaceae bacterium]|jgi:hemin uptake protein HemP|nr:hemin uptake protein HemP [Paracoccaceae bacterium]
MDDDRPHREAPRPQPPLRYRAEDLLSGADRAEIALGDQVYTLRMTRSGKLILTK